MELKYCINNEDKKQYKNIHSILRNKLHISNRLLTKLIQKNCITLNNSICDTRHSFNDNDILTINFDYYEDNMNIVSTPMDLDIRPVNRLDSNTSRISHLCKMFIHTRNT